MSNNKINPWDLDIRVRERNLQSGALTDKDIDKLHAGLTDLADQVDAVAIPQPAIGGRSDTD